MGDMAMEDRGPGDRDAFNGREVALGKKMSSGFLGEDLPLPLLLTVTLTRMSGLLLAALVSPKDMLSTWEVWEERESVCVDKN